LSKVTREKLLAMLVMRAMGFRQEEIGKQLKVSTNTVKYYLQKMRKRAQEEGLPLVFYSVVLSPLGASIITATTLERIVQRAVAKRSGSRGATKPNPFSAS